MPITPLQSLAFLKPSTPIRCKRPIQGFTRSSYYFAKVGDMPGFFIERRPNADMPNGTEDVGTSFREIVIMLRDDSGIAHFFSHSPPQPHQVASLNPQLSHTIRDLLIHFSIPPTRDIARRHPKKFQDLKKQFANIIP